MITKKTKAEKDKAAERADRTHRALQAAGVRAWRESMTLQASLDVVGKAWRQMQELADGAAEDEAEDEAEDGDDMTAEAQPDTTAATQPDRDGIPPGTPSVGEQIGVDQMAADALGSAGQP